MAETNDQYLASERAAELIRKRIAPHTPELGVILGSGLGAFGDALGDPVAVPYAEIPGFAQSSVAGHAGRLVAGLCGKRTVVAMQGRVHFYEGHPLSQIVLPIRALILAGCKTLVITNAAGGIRDDLYPGDLVLISDHINLSGQNPLIGPNDERFGVRFPDMSTIYDPELRVLAHQQAQAEGIDLKEGVYSWLSGPSYETPAEIRMLRRMGADLCGMSTVPEAIVCRHMGARVLGISCVTNKAAGLGGKLSHEEVAETAGRVRDTFIALLSRICSAIRESQ
ncbi:MAG: purine-nucleoside phosphorylase [Deltaproteobacteria bacterium]|nr:purine-nucleoside phosphorylase [Deltaproteobacteria bacterium]